jgi:4-hydroxy-tetrahydrodipicolinate reductase
VNAGASVGAKETARMDRGPIIKVAVCGALGRMGRVTCEAVAADAELQLAAAVDTGFERGAPRVLGSGRDFTQLGTALDHVGIDVVVDFTVPSSVLANVLTCVGHRAPVVVGTTGLQDADFAEIEQAARQGASPVLIVPNFAMGAVLMMDFARQAARYFQACEIVELHHDKKVDTPSGTSRLTQLRIEEAWGERGLDKEVPIHSVRLPGLVAHQEVLFGGVGETLTIRHDSLSRESFMPGVILAVKRVRSLQGLVVGLENIL